MLEQFVVQLSSPAGKDLDNIANFIMGNFDDFDSGAYVVDKVITGILRKIRTLRAFPNGYKIVDSDGSSGNEYHQVHHKHYNIYYYVDNDEKIVNITAIVDARRDPKYVRSRLK